MNRPSNPPHKHHYVPQFYLAQWATAADDRLCEYSRPYDEVKPKRRHPAETGYIDRLYELKGLEGPVAQSLETRFFSPVDSVAADALQQMIRHRTKSLLPRRRSGWAQFLHSMLLRMPEDLELFKQGWRQLMLSDYDEHWEQRYREIRKPTDPPTYQGYMAMMPPDQHDRTALNALAGMMASVNVGQRISDMLWQVLETDADDYPLLTSDRPIIRSNGLNADNGHIAMPIGPHRLFIAAKNRAVLNSIVSLGRRKLVRETNRLVTRHAVKFVYGVDDRQIDFVKKHFNAEPDPRLLESTARKIDDLKASIVAFDQAQRR